ncbi:MAG: CoA transferase [Dehalococcoidia bacterium]|nr:CoA transferase [Dehalococcoidia bacterium]
MATLPLEGYRVIDLGQVWVGPMLGHYLADYGAEVIRVDTARRQKMTAGGRRPAAGPTDPMSFQNYGRNKLSVTLDLTKARGQELFKEIVKVSDIVFDNFSPRVMKRFGLDYEALRQVKPDIIVASLSAVGQDGPWWDILTYGPSLAALYGIKSHLGYHGEEKVQEDLADLDPTAATYAFFAVLAALEYRERSGKGQFIDLAQGEAALCSFGESVLECTMSGHVLGRQGNRYPGMAPHGIYRCGGDDKWVSIAVKTEEEWNGLCQALGKPPWSSDERFADLYQRLNHQDELDDLIEEWTMQRTHKEVTELLQSHGVAAFPIFNAEDLFLNAHCEYRRSMVTVEHPNFSPAEAVYGIPWKLSETPGSIRQPNPSPGSHNDYVLGKLLGMSSRQIKGLVDEEVIC